MRCGGGRQLELDGLMGQEDGRENQKGREREGSKMHHQIELFSLFRLKFCSYRVKFSKLQSEQVRICSVEKIIMSKVTRFLFSDVAGTDRGHLISL